MLSPDKACFVSQWNYGVRASQGCENLNNTTWERWVNLQQSASCTGGGSDVSETWCWTSLDVLLFEGSCLFVWQQIILQWLFCWQAWNLISCPRKSCCKWEPAGNPWEPNTIAVSFLIGWIHSLTLQAVLSVPKNALISVGVLWASFFKQAQSCSLLPPYELFDWLWCGLWLCVTSLMWPSCAFDFSITSECTFTCKCELCSGEVCKYYGEALRVTFPSLTCRVPLSEVQACGLLVLLLCSPRGRLARHSPCTQLLQSAVAVSMPAWDEIPQG